MEKTHCRMGSLKTSLAQVKEVQSKEKGKKVGTQWENVIKNRVINGRTSQIKIQ